MRQNDAMGFVHRDFLTAGVAPPATETDCAAAKILEKHDADGGEGKSTDSGDVPEMGSYVMSSEISK